MKKHIMSGHDKRYLHVNPDHSLIDHEYELVQITTYCGKEYETVADAIANNVFRSLPSDDPDACKTCTRWRDGYRHQRQLREWGKMKRVWA